MEPLFINEYTVTYALMKEWAQQPLTKKAVKARRTVFYIRLFGSIISFLLLMGSIVTIDFFYIFVFGGLSVYFLFLLLLYPEWRLKKKYKQALKLLGDKAWVRSIVFADNIIIDDGRITMRYDYSEITGVTETIDYFKFIGDKTAFGIRKDSFTLGTVDGFRDFIYKNCNAASEIPCKPFHLITF